MAAYKNHEQSLLDSLIHGAGQGATFGLSDEISAGLTSLFGSGNKDRVEQQENQKEALYKRYKDDPKALAAIDKLYSDRPIEKEQGFIDRYREGKQIAREADKVAKDAHPAAYAGADLVASLLTPGVYAKGMTKIPGLKTAGTWLQGGKPAEWTKEAAQAGGRWAPEATKELAEMALKRGAAMGAAHGYGRSESDSAAGDLGNAGIGALLGGLLGYGGSRVGTSLSTPAKEGGVNALAGASNIPDFLKTHLATALMGAGAGHSGGIGQTLLGAGVGAAVPEVARRVAPQLVEPLTAATVGAVGSSFGPRPFDAKPEQNMSPVHTRQLLPNEHFEVSADAKIPGLD